jgi:peptidoglycan/xylan/chitin deacetylase (PgdA/CDA1 family)
MGWKALVREGVARTVRGSGLPSAVRAVTRRRVTIAFYHDPSPERFEAHVRYLDAHYRFTTLDAVVDALRDGDWSGIPERALVFTFDDGHRGNHRLLPVFRRYRIRPTIYLCSQIVGTQRGYWVNEPMPGGRIQALKRVPDEERLRVLREATGYEPLAPRPGPRQALSRDEILEMASDVDFGSHTRTHPILTQCSDERALEEIEGSRHDLEALLGRPCRHFCPPNGDWGEREVELARKAGYDSSRTTDVGWVGPGSDPYRLRVAALSDDVTVDVLAAQLSGLPRFVRNLSRGRLGAAEIQTPVAR